MSGTGDPGNGPPSLPLQPAAWDVWDRKYRLRDATGRPLEDTPAETLARVARALADVEATPALREHWRERFLWALNHGALPAGRILANAGARDHKRGTSTINCTVSGTIHDTLDDILGKLREAGLTLQSGAGIGYEFSTLRPKGAWVAGAGARSSGPLSFMDVYDQMCRTIASAGDRRGAQMATFHIGHPDVLEFIEAKREPGRLRQFNLSLLVPDAFMAALDAGEDWPLAFPLSPAEQARTGADLDDPKQVVWREWPITEGYLTDDHGRVACRVQQWMPAVALWEQVMRATYDHAEPGVIFIDRVNAENNNGFCEAIRAANPCGEQMLPPYGACLLGSVDLTRFVQHPFTGKVRFDWDTYREVVAVFTRMLDNVVEIHGLPLVQQAEALERTRRHGMGFLGLGSALALMGIRYGSEEAAAFTARAARELALTGWRTGLALAREKGPAPLMEERFTVTEHLLARYPALAEDGIRVGDVLPGRVLHARYSPYMRRIAGLDPALVAALAEEGARFTHHSAIAPTGTIALSFGNNVSNGIEPSFAHTYLRNILARISHHPSTAAADLLAVTGRAHFSRLDVVSATPAPSSVPRAPSQRHLDALATNGGEICGLGRDGATRDTVPVTAYELLAWRALVDPDADPEAKQGPHRLPEAFVTAGAIAPRAHLAIQAAAQPWIDAAISKTINVPTDCPFEDFRDLYREAHALGLKGCTTYRLNPAAFQGVLLRPEDLAHSRYRFILRDGRCLSIKGDRWVRYGEHRELAANLYGQLRERGIRETVGDLPSLTPECIDPPDPIEIRVPVVEVACETPHGVSPVCPVCE
ncbi:adenosylcobalamin-dependent ribonucleoside-diphosphate reductase [Thioalkalivibrio sulfidiphilus]|uniref:adenosylcobalamin-dependent ribonucleoside-diphosphate reductase n=1 Tax=Thioalkalivibrio sulfidiphilus TaxID=1033854 RepID=UPI0003697825|nr:adenosylcobalamin-dependent ribonucleoside-diphosphate reductase [Thioalkalivibrio sulfidiphilus]